MQSQDHRFEDLAILPDGETDLVFDFSRMGTPDLGGIVLVLTARQIAEEDHRRVWAKSMSHRIWQLLGALGLVHLFELFPNSEDMN